jgi:hypothetical protein
MQFSGQRLASLTPLVHVLTQSIGTCWFNTLKQVITCHIRCHSLFTVVLTFQIVVFAVVMPFVVGTLDHKPAVQVIVLPLFSELKVFLPLPSYCAHIAWFYDDCGFLHLLCNRQQCKVQGDSQCNREKTSA